MTNTAQSQYIVATLLLMVNYDRSIAKSVVAGDYSLTSVRGPGKGRPLSDSDITDANFPSTETGEREVETALFYFNCFKISSKAVEAEMDKVGYRPATMKELLAYGEKNPEDQCERIIVELGSVEKCDGIRRVGCLVGDTCLRAVTLGHYNGRDWHGSHFLGVRK